MNSCIFSVAYLFYFEFIFTAWLTSAQRKRVDRGGATTNKATRLSKQVCSYWDEVAQLSFAARCKDTLLKCPVGCIITTSTVASDAAWWKMNKMKE